MSFRSYALTLTLCIAMTAGKNPVLANGDSTNENQERQLEKLITPAQMCILKTVFQANPSRMREYLTDHHQTARHDRAFHTSVFTEAGNHISFGGYIGSYTNVYYFRKGRYSSGDSFVHVSRSSIGVYTPLPSIEHDIITTSEGAPFLWTKELMPTGLPPISWYTIGTNLKTGETLKEPTDNTGAQILLKIKLMDDYRYYDASTRPALIEKHNRALKCMEPLF